MGGGGGGVRVQGLRLEASKALASEWGLGGVLCQPTPEGSGLGLGFRAAKFRHFKAIQQHQNRLPRSKA